MNNTLQSNALDKAGKHTSGVTQCDVLLLTQFIFGNFKIYMQGCECYINRSSNTATQRHMEMGMLEASEETKLLSEHQHNFKYYPANSS